MMMRPYKCFRILWKPYFYAYICLLSFVLLFGCATAPWKSPEERIAILDSYKAGIDKYRERLAAMIKPQEKKDEAETEIIQQEKKVKEEAVYILEDEEEEKKPIGYIREYRITQQPLGNYKTYLSLGYNLTEYSNNQNDMDADELAFAYTFYFGGIPDYEEIPIDLQPFFIHRSNFKLYYKNETYDEDEESAGSWTHDSKSDFGADFEFYLGNEKNFSFLLGMGLTDYKADMVEGASYDFDIDAATNYNLGIRYYYKPNLRFSFFYFNSQFDENFEYTYVSESYETSISSQKFLIEYVWGVSVKFNVGYYDRQLDFDSEYPDDDEDESSLYYGAQYFFANNRTSIGLEFGQNHNIISLGHYFNRNLKLGIDIFNFDDDEDLYYRNSRVEFALTYRL